METGYYISPNGETILYFHHGIKGQVVEGMLKGRHYKNPYYTTWLEKKAIRNLFKNWVWFAP